MYKAIGHKLRLISLVLIVLSSTGCQYATSVPTGIATSSAFPSELSRNHQKWKDAGISHYQFRLFRACICEDNEDVLIEVESERIVSIEHPSGRTLNEYDRVFFDSVGTMERLFSTAENELNGDALDVNVKYDPTYGFPAEIYSDHTEITDDELYLTVSDFEVLP